MTNRERYFRQMSEYDLLIRILEHSKQCPLMLLGCGRSREWCVEYRDCHICIQKWLNNETKVV